MKQFNKTILAAALMVAAGSANAAFTNSTLDGTNEAFLVAFDANYVNTSGPNGRTFNLDLGTTFAALTADTKGALAAFEGSSAANNLASNANWNAFLTKSAGETTAAITYGVYAVGDYAYAADNLHQPNDSVFVTGAAAPKPNADPTVEWATVVDAVNTQAGYIANGAGAASSSLINQNAPGHTGQATPDTAHTFNGLWGGWPTNPVAAYGTANNLYQGVSHLDPTSQLTYVTASDIKNVGAFTLSGNTLSFAAPVSAVPLPAAVWMFGAGLMGVLRLNRRKSVQA